MSLLKKNKIKIYPIFLPNAGCRTRCVFCNQYVMTGEKNPNLEFIENLNIEEKIDEIAFYGGTFTGLPKETMIKLLSIKPDIPKRISTRPDCISDEIIHLLKQMNVRVIELGIESLDDEVLNISKRGYSSKDAINAVKLINNQFLLIAHLMVGLPQDNKEKDLDTIKNLLNVGVKIFRIHPTIVFKNTELERMFLSGEYEPISLEDAVDIVSEMVMLVEANGGQVVRIGYHIPESQKKFIVAGPYHPSFGDMVRSRIVRKIIEKLDVKSVEYNKKYEAWFNSHGNKFLSVYRKIVDEDRITFDGIDYKVAIERYLTSK